jgi:hypothetical protein
MIRDEIIHMAKEIAWQYGKAERFQTWTHDYMMDRLMELVTVSMAAEREACALICEELKYDGYEMVKDNPVLARKIRARGNQ